VSAPNLTIGVEPVEGGKAVFLRLAPTAASGKSAAKIVLRLRITNNEAKKVVVDKMRLVPGIAGPRRSTCRGLSEKGLPAVSQRGQAA